MVSSLSYIETAIDIYNSIHAISQQLTVVSGVPVNKDAKINYCYILIINLSFDQICNGN